MPSLGAYQRIVITGKGIGAEVWQTGFSTWVTTAITSQAGLQSYVNSIAPYVSTWWGALRPAIFNTFSLTGVSAYQYQAPSTHAQFQAGVSLTPVLGQLSGTGNPIDTCLVVSLRTAVPGRRTRGRMYIPMHAAVGAVDGCLSSITSQLYGTTTKTMLGSVVSGTAGVPIVVSRTGGTYETINSLVTDNKPDVQRRRENRLPATNTQVLSFP